MHRLHFVLEMNADCYYKTYIQQLIVPVANNQLQSEYHFSVQQYHREEQCLEDNTDGSGFWLYSLKLLWLRASPAGAKDSTNKWMLDKSLLQIVKISLHLNVLATAHLRCRLEGRFHSVTVTCLRECGGRCNLPSSELQGDRMHPFAPYVLRSYYKATGWNEDNLYANLTRSSDGKYFAHSSEMIFTQAH